jgi:DNA-binding IclR family transcriptional regulator
MANGLQPEWITARDLAAWTGWETAYAESILLRFALAGVVERDGYGKYRITTGKGMEAAGRAGVIAGIDEIISRLAKKSD